LGGGGGRPEATEILFCCDGVFGFSVFCVRVLARRCGERFGDGGGCRVGLVERARVEGLKCGAIDGLGPLGETLLLCLLRSWQLVLQVMLVVICRWLIGLEMIARQGLLGRVEEVGVPALGPLRLARTLRGRRQLLQCPLRSWLLSLLVMLIMMRRRLITRLSIASRRLCGRVERSPDLARARLQRACPLRCLRQPRERASLQHQ
jgi:hypothetical protein